MPTCVEDVELSLDPRETAFRARLLVPAPAGDAPLTGFDGRWTMGGGIIGTAVLVTAADDV